MANEERRRIVTFIGATARKLRFQMRAPDTGLPVDLSSLVSASISARFTTSGTYQISSAAMTVEAGTEGWVYFYPTSAQVDTKGDLLAQIRLDYATDLDYCDEYIIEVRTPHDAAV